jgi:hypothetical protein
VQGLWGLHGAWQQEAGSAAIIGHLLSQHAIHHPIHPPPIPSPTKPGIDDPYEPPLNPEIVVDCFDSGGFGAVSLLPCRALLPLSRFRSKAPVLPTCYAAHRPPVTAAGRQRSPLEMAEQILDVLEEMGYLR